MQFFRPSTDRLNNSHTKLLLRGDAIADASPNVKAITNTGTVPVISTTGLPVGSRALDFTGSNHLSCAMADLSQCTDFTIDYWIKTTQSVDKVVASQSYTSGNGNWSAMQSINDVYVYTYDGVSNSEGMTGGAISSGAWAHIALCREGTTAKCYINGVLSSTATISKLIGTAANVLIGRDAINNNGVHSLAGFRITVGQVLWTKNFIPPARTL